MFPYSHRDSKAKCTSLLGSRLTNQLLTGYCVGTSGAAYDIGRSRLDAPGSQFLLEKVQINAGKYVQAGLGFAPGIKDFGFHVPRKAYPVKLRTLMSRYVIFWDTAEKRGWLINASSALLHLIRATLKSYETDELSRKLLSDHRSILEPHHYTNRTYPYEVLTDERNMALKIYADRDVVDGEARKRKYYCLEDRVEEIYEALDKLLDHQAEKAGQAGWKIKTHARRHLEGWDFKDLVSDRDPVYPKSETLHARGKGWVDFARSIHAVTLFGKGFGDIISPECNIGGDHWERVPFNKYYLTTRVSDLQAILETEGDDTLDPMKICEGLLWFSPRESFDQCRPGPRRVSSDPVQVLWPMALKKRRPNLGKATLHTDGAVIFGHNVTHRILWEDHGDPQEGDPELETTDNILLSAVATTSGTSNSELHSRETASHSGAGATSFQQSTDNEGVAAPSKPDTESALRAGAQAVAGSRPPETTAQKSGWRSRLAKLQKKGRK